MKALRYHLTLIFSLIYFISGLAQSCSNPINIQSGYIYDINDYVGGNYFNYDWCSGEASPNDDIVFKIKALYSGQATVYFLKHLAISKEDETHSYNPENPTCIIKTNCQDNNTNIIHCGQDLDGYTFDVIKGQEYYFIILDHNLYNPYILYWSLQVNMPSNLSGCACNSSFDLPICEDFDQYTTYKRLSEQSYCWTTWDGSIGGSKDGIIEKSYGNNYLVIGNNNEPTDMVLQLGTESYHKYSIEFKLWEYSGEKAYYNVLHKFVPNSKNYDDEHAYEVFFNYPTLGKGYLKVGGQSYSFTHNTGKWISVKNIIDIYNNKAQLFIDNKKVHEWPFDYTPLYTSGGTKQLAAVDFYRYEGKYSVDNIVVDYASEQNCPAPHDPTIISKGYFGAIIEWESDIEDSDIASYETQVREYGTSEWSFCIDSGGFSYGCYIEDQYISGEYIERACIQPAVFFYPVPYLALNALKPDTEYEVRVKANCKDGSSDWSSVVKFKTDSFSDGYTTSDKFSAARGEFEISLDNFRINGIKHGISTCEEDGCYGCLHNPQYHNYHNDGYHKGKGELLLVEGTNSFDIAISPDTTITYYGIDTISRGVIEGFIRIWIDYDNDKVFENNELIYESPKFNTIQDLSGSFDIVSGWEGTRRMRVIFEAFEKPQPYGYYRAGFTYDFDVRNIPEDECNIPEIACDSWLHSIIERESSLCNDDFGILHLVEISPIHLHGNDIGIDVNYDIHENNSQHKHEIYNCSGELLATCFLDGNGQNSGDITLCDNINFFSGSFWDCSQALPDCSSTPPWDIEKCSNDNTQNIILDRINDRFYAEINGKELSTDDWIGVFYTDDNGGEHCQAAVKYPDSDESFAMVTCKDNEDTNIKDGFAIGEDYKFRILNKETGGEYLDLSADFWEIGAFGYAPSAEESFVGGIKKSYLKKLKKKILIGDADCTNPIEISCNTTLTGLTNETGKESKVDLFCDSDNYVNGPEVYFKFSHSILSDVKIKISNLKEDLELYVLDENCNAYNCIATSENQETDSEILLIKNLSQGEYFLVVDGYIDATSTFDIEVKCGNFGGGGNGDGDIDPDDPDDPPTSQCPKKLNCGSSVSCTTVGLENKIFSYGCTPNRFNGGQEKIFTFKSPETKWVYISMIPEAGVNLDLFALSGLNSQTDCIKSSTEFGDASEGFYFLATANKNYYIVVDGYDEDAGSFTLTAGSCVTPGGGGSDNPPIELDCDNIDEVFCGTPYNGSNVNGSLKYQGWGNCSGKSNTGKEVLLKFNNPAPQQVLFLLKNMTENLNLYILDACDPFSCLGQGGTKGREREDNQDEAVIIPLLDAGEYYIVIDGVKNAVSDFELDIECEKTSFPCIDIPLKVGGVNYISSNILPPDRSIKNIFDKYSGIIKSVQDDRGNAYTLGDPCNQNCPQVWNDIDAFAILLDPSINNDTSITICGAKVDTNSVKDIVGYNPINNDPYRINYIGYPFEENIKVSEAFSKIPNIKELNQIVYKSPNAALKIYDFAAPNTNDFFMKPGQGYVLYSYTDRQFSYRSDDVPVRENGCRKLKMPWYGTYNVSHAHFTSKILSKYMNSGDEIAFINEKGDVISSLKYRGENATIVLQGDMKITEYIDGYTEGEEMYIKTYNTDFHISNTTPKIYDDEEAWKDRGRLSSHAYVNSL